jgi:hypothetical protein
MGDRQGKPLSRVQYFIDSLLDEKWAKCKINDKKRNSAFKGIIIA